MNKILKLILIIISVVVFFIILFFLFSIIILGLGLQGNYDENTMSLYKDKEARNNYFKQNENYFNNIVSIFETYPEIKDIKNFNEVCNSEETEIKTNENIIFCIENNSKNTEKIKNLKIKNDIKSLSEIIVIDKNEDNIVFYIIKSTEGKIYYNYCLNPKHCNNLDKYVENKNGTYEKNIINNNWYSIWTNIPTI